MPTYEYKCEACGVVTEVFHGFRDAGPEECSCGARGTMKRLISPGSGVIFKGSGFYETDYKRKPPETTAKKSSDSAEGAEKAATPAKESSATKPAPAKSKDN